MSNDVELASNRFDNGISNTANGLSWLTTPPGISCSPCWSAASSGSSNIFIRNSEEAFCEQLGTPVVNASASERSTANTGMSIGLFKYSFFTLIQSVFWPIIRMNMSAKRNGFVLFNGIAWLPPETSIHRKEWYLNDFKCTMKSVLSNERLRGKCFEKCNHE